MLIEIPQADLTALVAKQVDNLFFLRDGEERVVLRAAIDVALERCEYCFSRTGNKYYHRNGQTCFNPFHSGQYCIFLYFLSRAIFTRHPQAATLADRVYYLNKALNGVDLFYEVEMPNVFLLDHPVGSVMGRARYGEFFTFSQNCTVGNNKGVYPTIGQNVQMMAGSMIVGRCRIGDNVILAAGSYVKDADVPSCSIVFGRHPENVIKKKDESYFHSESYGGAPV